MGKFIWYNGQVWVELETGDLSQEFVDSVDAASLINRCFGTAKGDDKSEEDHTHCYRN